MSQIAHPLSAGPLAGKLNALEIRMQSGEKVVHEMNPGLVYLLSPRMILFIRECHSSSRVSLSLGWMPVSPQ